MEKKGAKWGIKKDVEHVNRIQERAIKPGEENKRDTLQEEVVIKLYTLCN